MLSIRVRHFMHNSGDGFALLFLKKYYKLINIYVLNNCDTSSSLWSYWSFHLMCFSHAFQHIKPVSELLNKYIIDNLTVEGSVKENGGNREDSSSYWLTSVSSIHITFYHN